MKFAERVILAMLKKQGYRCALTGRELTPEVTSVDHRVPVKRGGDPGTDNVWLVHEDVNRAKGTLTAEEFTRLCREVVAHQRRCKAIAPQPSQSLLDTQGSQTESLPLFEEHTNVPE